MEPLVATLGGESEVVRRSAAEALGKIGDTRAVEPLIVALGDENGDVRWQAVQALRRIGTTKAWAALKKEGFAG